MMRFISLLLLGLCACVVSCSHVVVFDLSVRLSWYPMWSVVLDMCLCLGCGGVMSV